MFRSTAPRLATAVLVVAAMAPFALPVSGANAAPQDRTVQVFDFTFDPVSRDVEAGDTVVWVLDQSATNPHQVTLDADGNGDFDDDDNGEFDLSSADLGPGSALRHTFDRAGKYQFFCKYHLIQYGMAGNVQVAEPPPPPTTTTTTEPPPTTTTTAPPPTTVTTAPAPTTTTTRPRSTTTTTKPATTPTTQPPASASNDTSGTTSTTARATTTTGKATTTTGKKKPATTTTKPPETTTTSALPAEWIPTPDMVPDGSPTTTTTAPELQAAADHRPKSGKGGGGGGLPVAGAAGLGVLLLGALGWAWYHRSSRYLPA